jgi:hypothetical protein
MLWNPAVRVDEERRAPNLKRWLATLFEVLAPWALERLGQERLDWLRAQPREWRSDTTLVVHASPDDLWRAPMPDAPGVALPRNWLLTPSRSRDKKDLSVSTRGTGPTAGDTCDRGSTGVRERRFVAGGIAGNLVCFDNGLTVMRTVSCVVCYSGHLQLSAADRARPSAHGAAHGGSWFGTPPARSRADPVAPIAMGVRLKCGAGPVTWVSNE